jgi:hypothetical protein
VVLFGLIYLAALLGIPPRQIRATWLLPLLWFAMTWTRIRNGPLFVITAALALAEMYPHVRWREWLAQRGSVTCRLQPNASASAAARRDWRPALVPCLVVLTAVVLQAAAIRVPLLGRGWAGFDPAVTPIELLPQLKAYEKAAPSKPIFNDMLYGGFLIYFTPDLKVFIDDRCELYGDDFLAQYAEVMVHHPERIEDWAQKYRFDHALVFPGSPMDRYLEKAAGWQEVRRTAGAVLYYRTPSAAGG